MAKSPAERPASAAATAEALKDLERQPAPPPRPRRGWLVAAALVVVLIPVAAWLATPGPTLETPDGTLVVEIEGDEVKARIKDGKIVLSGPDGKDRYSLSPSERNKTLPAGDYRIRVEGADGLALDTAEFTLEKGGKWTVRVTVRPTPPKPGGDDRAAAEQAFALGGTVMVAGYPHLIRGPARLPKEGTIRLLALNLRTPGEDGTLAVFKDCKHPTTLDLNQRKVGDAGLANFKGCPDLVVLNLGNTYAADAGLGSFRGCRKLKDLRLSNTKITDAGLANFAGCDDLERLDLFNTNITDKGLAHFKGCRKLKNLILARTKATEKGLALLAACADLESLSLPDGVADLSPLKGMKLVDLTLKYVPELHAKALRGHPTLKTINGKPAADVLKPADE